MESFNKQQQSPSPVLFPLVQDKRDKSNILLDLDQHKKSSSYNSCASHSSSNSGGGRRTHSNSPLLPNSAAAASPAAEEDVNLGGIGAYDVMCGRHRLARNNVGNRRFRVLVNLNLDRYIKAKARYDRSVVMLSVVDMVKSAGGRFIKWDTAQKEWLELSEKQTREKVGHAFRDMALARDTANSNHGSNSSSDSMSLSWQDIVLGSLNYPPHNDNNNNNNLPNSSSHNFSAPAAQFGAEQSSQSTTTDFPSALPLLPRQPVVGEIMTVKRSNSSSSSNMLSGLQAGFPLPPLLVSQQESFLSSSSLTSSVSSTTTTTVQQQQHHQPQKIDYINNKNPWCLPTAGTTITTNSKNESLLLKSPPVVVVKQQQQQEDAIFQESTLMSQPLLISRESWVEAEQYFSQYRQQDDHHQQQHPSDVFQQQQQQQQNHFSESTFSGCSFDFTADADDDNDGDVMAEYDRLSLFSEKESDNIRRDSEARVFLDLFQNELDLSKGDDVAEEEMEL